MGLSRRRSPSTSTTRRLIIGLLLAGGVAVLLTACAAGANPVSGGADPAGFWLGLWQGFIAPIAFLVSLFNHDVGIYEVHNSGAWYNFGFLIGVSAFFSGPAGARRTRATKKARS